MQPACLPAYVNRPVLNTEQIRDHYLAQGYPEQLMDPPRKWHVTLAYSTKPFVWRPPIMDLLEQAANERAHELFDPLPGTTRDCHVLLLDFRALNHRWEGLCRAGAHWKHPTYRPHITIGRCAAGQLPWVANYAPYAGPILLGPECWNVLHVEQ